MAGPVILENLCGLLMILRLNKVALIADVEKAFLQVELQPDDRDVTRFFSLKVGSHVMYEKSTPKYCQMARKGLLTRQLPPLLSMKRIFLPELNYLG